MAVHDVTVAEKFQGSRVSQLLQRWSSGDRRAAERVLPLVYDELHEVADRCFRHEHREHTLQATALIHEAYIQLVEQRGLHWSSHAHFLGVAACIMRRILVNYSRERNRAKRGGRAAKVTLMEAAELTTSRPPDVEALDDALKSLAEIDPLKASVVELRYFGGMKIDEIAECLGVAPITVSRQWRRARAWLLDELSPSAPAPHA
ncbi:MAG: sigma-70 family RNA polymerase sigma factor [bacterium]|nr:sigma-70 family RNA polymerase sigma factor [bacterium]